MGFAAAPDVNILSHFPGLGCGSKPRVFFRLRRLLTPDSMTSTMFFELLRLALGFTIAAFHRPIADYIMEHERVLVIAFRQRGIPAPLFSREMARIWSLAHPGSALLFLLGR